MAVEYTHAGNLDNFAYSRHELSDVFYVYIFGFTRKNNYSFLSAKKS